MDIKLKEGQKVLDEHGNEYLIERGDYITQNIKEGAFLFIEDIEKVVNHRFNGNWELAFNDFLSYLIKYDNHNEYGYAYEWYKKVK